MTALFDAPDLLIDKSTEATTSLTPGGVNGILKMEFLLHRPKDLAEARRMVDESMQIYNQERPHLPLKYKTPDAVHRAFCV
jgi:transposase InsO family protein